MTKNGIVDLLKTDVSAWNKWRNENPDVKIDLYRANLMWTNLAEANLTRANLMSANLMGANLRGAYFWRANLAGANLAWANLADANLRETNLCRANLKEAYLVDADLRDADLRNADLADADMENADLRDADLMDADLWRANLEWADLNFNQLSAYQRAIFNICPTGEFEAYKKIASENGDLIIKIIIPAKAKRMNALSSRECRAEYANFDKIVEGDMSTKEGWSRYDKNFKYDLTKGAEIVPDRYDESNVACGNGVHFFLTKEEAEQY